MAIIELGLGLVSIGRRWGVRDVAPPPPEEAIALIEAAVAGGIRFFDTAPAYGASEDLLGRALRGGGFDASRVTIATKFGEHWNADTATPFADHRYDALAASLERSLERLGRIDLVQLHKATVDTIASPDVLRALDLAARCGITRFGASVSDVETARLACLSGRYDALQFPFNGAASHLAPVFALLRDHGMRAIVNRPFAMGGLVGDGAARGVEAFRTVLAADFDGIVLTGTSSRAHLAENIAAFAEARGG